MKKDSDYREPTKDELAVLQRITSYEFAGKEFIDQQIKSCRVRPDGKNGSLEIIVLDKQKAKFIDRVPAEGIAKDEDGMDINFLLHVDSQGYMRMLEVYRSDGAPVRKFPQASEITAPPW